MATNRGGHWTSFIVSLPERVVRSATALAGGLLKEIGDVTIPKTLRRTQLYQNLVEALLRFLIEQVGEVEGVYPGGDKLSEDFLLRRAAGNGIELVGILAFRASPVWVLAALADVSGAGRHLIREISGTLKEEGLLDKETEFGSVDQMLDGLERSAGRLAGTVNSPPLDVATLRREWEGFRKDVSRIPPRDLPGIDVVTEVWQGIQKEAQVQQRTMFEVSSVMAMSAAARLPEKARWLSISAGVAAIKTGEIAVGVILDHYREALSAIHETGYVQYAVRQFRPYLHAAASQFSRGKRSLTERLLDRQ